MAGVKLNLVAAVIVNTDKVHMKAIILLATLKKQGLSNTAVLSEFFREKLLGHGISCEIIRLVNHRILPGTYSDMGEGDEWPDILNKIMAADLVLFATPIWWNNFSSEMQKVIERLDHLHDGILEGRPSPLEGKVGGILITGDSDGAQQIIGGIANFFNAIGLVLPPFASLSVLWEGQRKGADTPREELLVKYREYESNAETMISQLKAYALNSR
ncbi:MAG TPA: flavodoxin family protein [Sphingobacteriaceae bacterium]